MWLFNSSIGRKLVMAITGACLVLFVTFHVLMNSVALIWPTAYNQVCEFLGANWYALLASAGLGFLFILHIVYACWLTVQNRKARGGDRYAVTTRPPQVEWASKNMLVLGIVILAFLVVHLIQFWAKMQWQELRHAELSVLPQLEGHIVEPAQGTLFLQLAFSEVWTPIVYIIGFVALWFHMNHGFWSMFHSTGWNNQTWLPRLKKIACWWTTIVVALFIAQAIVFTVHAHTGYYLDNAELQSQYAETYGKKADEMTAHFIQQFNAMQNDASELAVAQKEEAEKAFLSDEGVRFLENAVILIDTYEARCPKAGIPPQGMQQMGNAFNYVMQRCMQKGITLPEVVTNKLSKQMM